jgi:hypothetical protein
MPINAALMRTGWSPIMKRISLMRALVADSRLNANEEGTFMVNQGLIFVVKAALIFMVSARLTGSGAH